MTRLPETTDKTAAFLRAHRVCRGGGRLFWWGWGRRLPDFRAEASLAGSMRVQSVSPHETVESVILALGVFLPIWDLGKAALHK